MAENRKTTRPAGRPAIGGNRRQYVVTDDVHAWIMAHGGGKYLTDCTLYVTVEPCVMCAGAIGWAQIPRIVFGAYDEKRGFRRYAPKAMHPKAEIIGGVLEEECAALMTDFFANLRKMKSVLHSSLYWYVLYVFPKSGSCSASESMENSFFMMR